MVKSENSVVSQKITQQNTTNSDPNIEGHSDHHSVRGSLPIITVEGTFANIFIILTGGAFLTGLALMLGANDFQIGVIAAIPFIAQIAQLFSAYLIDRSGKKKSITFWSILVGRQIWWLLIPLLFLSGEWRLGAMMAIIVISSVATMIASPGWMSWVADLIPDKVRGRYFGQRNAAIAISTISTTIVGGIILDKFLKADQEPLGFIIILFIACVSAVAALVLLHKTPEKSPATPGLGISWSHIMEPFKNATFRHLINVFFVWNIALGISAAFFAPHMLNNLKMSFTQIAFYSSISALVAVLLFKPWGILIDRFGSKPVIVFCAFAIAFIPLVWLFPRADFLWILSLEAIYGGIVWSGFNLAAFNVPIANSPKQGRAIYLAVFAVATGLAFFAASVLGGFIAQKLTFIHWHIGKQIIVNYHLLFVLSTILRIISAFLILSFHEPKEKSLPIMIQFMGYAVLKRFWLGRQLFPWTSRLNHQTAMQKSMS